MKEKPKYSKDKTSLKISSFLQNYLSLLDTSVPAIVKTLDGQDYLQIGSRVFFVTPYVEGVHYRGTKKEAYNAGVKLGEIHRLSSSINSSPIHTYETLPTDIGRKFLDLASDFISKSGEYENWESELITMYDYLKEAESSIAGSKNLQFLLGHGDYNPFNLVFQKNGGQVVGVNDFDNVALLLRIHDLAEALLTFGYISYRGCTSSYAENQQKNMCHEWALALFEGYCSVVRLLDEEMEFLDRAVISIWIELISLGIIREDFGFSRLKMFPGARITIKNFIKSL